MLSGFVMNVNVNLVTGARAGASSLMHEFWFWIDVNRRIWRFQVGYSSRGEA
jgi:hypothetical protein